MVDEVRFEGADAIPPEQLLRYLNVAESGFWPIGGPAYYNDGLARVDEARLVRAYAALGFHDARVERITIEVIGEGQPLPVRVVVAVVEGEPVRAQRVRFDWSDGRPAHAAEIESMSPLGVGDVFSVGALNDARGALRSALQARGHALAEVVESAEVDRDARAASVAFRLSPGPRLRIGAVHLRGLERVPADLTRNEVDFAEGRWTSPALYRRLEQRAYAMDVFRAATVRPAGEPDADDRIDLDLHLEELPSQRIKIGVGFGFEPARWEERVTVLYTHRNLFGRLVRLDLRTKVGYAELPAVWDPQAHGPIFRTEPRFRRKGWLERELVWTLAPAFELGIDEGYQFYSPELRTGVSRFFFGRLLFEIGHRVQFVDFFNISQTFSSNRTQLGRDFRDPYLLSMVEAGPTLYLTDDVLEPANGLILDAKWGTAGGVFGGDYDFHKVEGGARVYWQVTERLQVGGRARGGTISTYGDQPGAPIPLKFALGGADTVRGWGLKRLSPQVFDCDDPVDCRGVPIGGFSMFLGNAEVRYRVVGPLLLAAFLDVGDVQPDTLDWRPDDWNYSTGGGPRVATPGGRFRLDFGWRLNETPRFAGEERWALHFALGETF